MKRMPLVALLLVSTAACAQEKVVLKTKLPPPLFVGTPVPHQRPQSGTSVEGQAA